MLAISASLTILIGRSVDSNAQAVLLMSLELGHTEILQSVRMEEVPRLFQLGGGWGNVRYMIDAPELD